MAEPEDTNAKARDTVLGVLTKAFDKAMPHHQGISPEERYKAVEAEAKAHADAFFADPNDKAAAKTRMNALSLTQALHPQIAPDHPVYGIVAEMGYSPELVRSQSQRDDYGNPYTGGGWTESEKRGRTPGAWELSPGDYLAHQRQLAHDTLASIAEATRLQHAAQFAPKDYGADAYARNFATGKMAEALQSFEGSRGNRDASGFFGSTYPQRQGGNAISDALTSPASPTGQYLNWGLFFSDAAAHAGMTDADPMSRAAVTNESNYHWNRPSPHHVPEGTAEERDAYIARARELTEQTRPPSYSMAYARQHGQPPSYAWQKLMSVANAAADPSMPAFLGAGKLVNFGARALAKTGVPVASQYGAHIAGKTAAMAAARPGAVLAREAGEDGVTGLGLEGLVSAAEAERPAFFFPKLRGLPSAWEGGWKNRPDLRAALLADNVSVDTDPAQTPSRSQMLQGKSFNQHFDEQQEKADLAERELEVMNRQLPESFDRSGVLGRIGAAAGDAAWSFLAPSLLDQGKPGQPGAMPKYMLSR